MSQVLIDNIHSNKQFYVGRTETVPKVEVTPTKIRKLIPTVTH